MTESLPESAVEVGCTVRCEFFIGVKYALELENKFAVLKEEAHTETTLNLMMMTVSGIKRNEHSCPVHSQVRLFIVQGGKGGTCRHSCSRQALLTGL